MNKGEMMKDYIRWPLIVVMIIVLIGLCHWAKTLELHDVRTVYDGDTIQLDDGRKIRLIGVDAPEVKSVYSKEEPFGEESKRYLEKLLLGKKVYIKIGAEQFDKYGRTLAYVYMDDVLLNGRIIKDGWARAYVRFDYEYKDLFVSYEKEAKSRGIGIWSRD